ncbi:MAG: hypothetical protein KF746_22170 [Chitinophagaceae bacterium]|nr:hypothetical protein [Chitinophagaceae bacterium]
MILKQTRMELDELKKIWMQAEHETGSGSDAALLGMLREQSKSPVTKMRRNLLIELIVVLISVSAVAIYYFTAFEGRLQQESWAYIILALIFVWYYYRKNKLLKSMQCVECRVKSNLELQLKTLEKYIRLYIIIGTAVVPVLFYFLFHVVVQHNKIPLENSFGLKGHADTFALLYLLITITFTAVLYLINKWYIYLLYGRHIKKLKSLISEMEEG